MNLKQKNLKLSALVLNTGQVPGLPKNPRFIRDHRFDALKRSIADAPEMLDYRRLLVYPFEQKHVVICGNMRLRAARDLGYTELPCVILPPDTPPEKLREYAQKDNIAFGENDWEALANEWNAAELTGWGLELNLNDNGNDNLNPDDDFADKNQEVDVDEFSDKVKIAFMFTDEEWAFVNVELQKLNANKELALLALLGYEQ